jgi:hypothetical protein
LKSLETTMRFNDLIDRLIEECSGDARGALQVLLLINEHLEAQLKYYRSRVEPERRTLH